MTTPREQETETAEVTVLEMAPEQLGVEAGEPAAETEGTRLRALLEAIIYVLDEPMPAAQIAQVLGLSREVVEKALADLMAAAAGPGRGIAIREVAGGFKMSTKPEFHDELRAFVKKMKPPLKLSLAALETLAVIAYKQPITAPEIMEIRGVQGAGVLKTLLERKLITAAGRKQVVGRPVLYKTTKDFLVQFGLKDLSELPTLKEFEEWSRLALGDMEEEPSPDSAPRVAPPQDESSAEPSADAALPEAPAETANEIVSVAEGGGPASAEAVADSGEDASDEQSARESDDDESDDDDLKDEEDDENED